MSAYDTILLNSSPDALIVAAYLARSGSRVLVLEPTAQLGGAVATAEFVDGFRADIGLLSGRIDPAIVDELQLREHGLEVIERPSITSLLPDGRSFTLPSDRAAAAEVIATFSASDAERYGAFCALLDQAAALVRQAYAQVPPRGQNPNPSEAANLVALLNQLRGYGDRGMTEVMRILVMPIRDLLDEWFESDELKGLLASAAVRGLAQGPFVGGTTYTLLHHLALGDGYFRASAKGGTGAIVAALAAAAKQHGAEIRTDVGALRVVVENGAAVGVRLADGSTIAASRIVADSDVRQLYTNLVEPPELSPEFNRAVRKVRFNGVVARINFALRALPSFIGLDEQALRGTLVYAPSVNALERAFDDAKYGKLSAQPFLEATLPSVADPSLTPDGQHVLSVWVQYVPFRGNIAPQAIYDLALATLEQFAPGLRDLVLHAQVLTPQDFETRYGLSEGHLYGGEIALEQAFYLRPIPGYAQYRTPIEQLYVCGSATHPGGGISGLSAKNLLSVL
jgi:phytoene dehydrogenase-like protein